MKTKLIIALTLVSSIAFAGIEPAVAVVPGSSNKVYKVVYKSEATNKVKVTIFNSEKQVVFTESINNVNGFSRPYNFSSLPQGEYTIAVNDGNEIKTETINYQEEDKAMLAVAMDVKKLNSANCKYLITAKCKGLSVMTVNVYDASGNLLHNESHVVDKNFGVIYNLGGIDKYTFILTDAAGLSQSFTF